MLIALPECIYQYIKEDEDWINCIKFIDESILNIQTLQGMNSINIDFFDQYCIEHFQLDSYNWIKSLIHEYCPKYLFLYNIQTHQYSIEELLKLYHASYKQLDIETQYMLLTTIQNTYKRTEKDFWIWKIKITEFMKEHENKLLKDIFYYERIIRHQAFMHIHKLIDNTLLYSIDLLESLHQGIIDIFTRSYEIDLDNAYTTIPDLYIYILNIINMKFGSSNTETQFEQDLVNFDWKLNKFNYQYKDYDINQIQFKLSLFKFFIFRKNYSKAFELLEDIYLWTDNALLDLPKFFRGMTLLNKNNRIVAYSIIYLLLIIPTIFPHLQYKLNNISEEDTQWILYQLFMKKSEKDLYRYRNQSTFYIRHFTDTMKVIENLRDVAEVYYHQNDQEELKEMLDTLSDQFTQLEQEIQGISRFEE